MSALKPTPRNMGLVLALSLWAAAGIGAHEPVQDPRQLKYPALRDLEIPEVERVTLPNGMRLLLLEDHELPLIRVAARIRVGSWCEPSEKIGLAAITGAVMRSGGTPTQTGDEIDEALERMAASVDTSIGLDAGQASLSVPAKDIDRGLAIWADVLMHPVFREDKVALLKTQIHGAISRRNDSPYTVASREFERLLYGPDSVYARQAEHATVDRITRDDLAAFHRRYFGPNNMMVAAWGDFRSTEMREKIERALAGWASVAPVALDLPDVPCQSGAAVHLIPRSDTSQSKIYLGHLGGRMDDPDYYALTVMNQILGGGFTGRLYHQIRSREGLAYSVGGSYGMQYRHPGLFSLGCQTKSENTVRAIRALTEEIDKIRQEEVTEEELATAKEGYLNSFIFNFDTKDEVIRRMMTYEYYDYPADFLQRTKQGIKRVMRADVLRVAKAHLHPEKLQILVVGRPEAFGASLSVFGTVTQIDITIPTPKQ